MTQENALRQSEPEPTAELIAARIEQSLPATRKNNKFFRRWGWILKIP